MAKLLQLEAVRHRDKIAPGSTHGYTIDINLETAEKLARIWAKTGHRDMRIQDYIAAIVQAFATVHDGKE